LKTLNSKSIQNVIRIQEWCPKYTKIRKYKYKKYKKEVEKHILREKGGKRVL